MTALPRVRVTTAPTSEPVSLVEAKAHLSVTHASDDALIESHIKAARLHVEHVQGRALITQTLQQTQDEWPTTRDLELARPRLQSVTSVKYTPRGAAQLTLSTSSYLVDGLSEPGRVVLREGYDWPADELEEANGIVVEYAAGYTAATDVPETTKQAIKMLVAHWYERREAVELSSGGVIVEVPLGFETLVNADRVWGFA